MLAANALSRDLRELEHLQKAIFVVDMGLFAFQLDNMVLILQMLQADRAVMTFHEHHWALVGALLVLAVEFIDLIFALALV